MTALTHAPTAGGRSRLMPVAFLRDRCSFLQGALTGRVPAHVIQDDVLEGEALRTWTALLVPDAPWPPATQLALEELYLLHARVTERVARGGVADISPDVEHLAQAVWVDRLQRVTDRAVCLLG